MANVLDPTLRGELVLSSWWCFLGVSGAFSSCRLPALWVASIFRSWKVYRPVAHKTWLPILSAFADFQWIKATSWRLSTLTTLVIGDARVSEVPKGAIQFHCIFKAWASQESSSPTGFLASSWVFWTKWWQHDDSWIWSLPHLSAPAIYQSCWNQKALRTLNVEGGLRFAHSGASPSKEGTSLTCGSFLHWCPEGFRAGPYSRVALQGSGKKINPDGGVVSSHQLLMGGFSNSYTYLNSMSPTPNIRIAQPANFLKTGCSGCSIPPSAWVHWWHRRFPQCSSDPGRVYLGSSVPRNLFLRFSQANSHLNKACVTQGKELKLRKRLAHAR